MGAIQNSINGAIGAVAVAGRMIGNEKDSALLHGQQAADKAEEAQKDIDTAKLAKPKLERNKRLAEGEAAKANIEASNIGGKKGDKLQKRAIQANYSLEKATVALQNVEDEISTKRALIKQQQEAIKKGRAWGGNY